MANAASTQLQSLLYSSAELSYIRTSLSNPTTRKPVQTTSPPSSTQKGAHAQVQQQSPPLIIRPDGRSPTTFRPLTAETGVLPLTNGSARVCLADGSEAVVGVKADVEEGWKRGEEMGREEEEKEEEKHEDDDDDGRKKRQRLRRKGTVSVNVDLPGFRDDDALPTYLAAMIKEGLVGGRGDVEERLRIRGRFAWKLYVDILLLHSTPLSYPLPLLSLATHLALLDTRLPALVSDTSTAMSKPNSNLKTNYVNSGDDRNDRNDKSDGTADNEDDDPLFADDWGLAEPLFPLPSTSTSTSTSRREGKLPPSPPVTLLVMAVDESIIFDPSAQELAVADGVLAITVGYKDVDEGDDRTASSSNSSSDESSDTTSSSSSDEGNDTQPKLNTTTTSQRTASESSPVKRPVHLLSIRTIDPPSRLTHSGLPNALNPATGGTAVPPAHADLIVAKEELLAKRATAVAVAAAAAEEKKGENRNGNNNASGASGGGGNGNGNGNEDSTSADHGGVWSPPRGGLSRKVVKKMVDEVMQLGGVGEEVLIALEGVVKRR